MSAARRPDAASIVGAGLAFAALGALSRYELRSTETRWQVAAFAVAAFGAEGVRALAGGRASMARGAVGAVAAALAIVAMKFHLEPTARASDAAIVRHQAHRAARDIRERVDP